MSCHCDQHLCVVRHFLIRVPASQLQPRHPTPKQVQRFSRASRDASKAANVSQRPLAANKVSLANWSARDPPTIAGLCATFGLTCRVPPTWLVLAAGTDNSRFLIVAWLLSQLARRLSVCRHLEAVVGASTWSLSMNSISSRYPRCPFLGSRGLLRQSLTTRRQHRCSPACTCAADCARRQRSKLPHQLIHDVRPVARVSRQALPSRIRSRVSHSAPTTSSSVGGSSEQRRRTSTTSAHSATIRAVLRRRATC